MLLLLIICGIILTILLFLYLTYWRELPGETTIFRTISFLILSIILAFIINKILNQYIHIKRQKIH